MDVSVILRHIIAGFIAIDADWRIKTVNVRASTLLRRPEHELEGQSLWSAFPDLLGSPAEAELRAGADTQTERRVQHFSPALYNWFELWWVAADGGIYLFFRDVTDRARSLKSESVREGVRQVLADAPIAVTIMRGPEHRFEMMNVAARKLVGGRNLEGMTARMALPEIDAGIFDMLDQVYRSGKPVSMQDLEITYDRNGDGTRYTGTFDATYQPLREVNGSVGGIISVTVETTRHVQRRGELASQ